LRELRKLIVRAGPLGRVVERDLHFEPTALGSIARA